MLKRMLSFLFLLAALAMPAAASKVESSDSGAPPRVEAAEGGHEHQLVELDLPAAVWTLIIFLILLAVLYPTAWKQVLAGLKAREERIRKDIADAEAARTKAEATLREYNAQLANAEARAREILAKGTTDAENLAAQIRARAQQEAQESRDRATREIEEAKNNALSEIYEQTANLATSVAEKILRRNLNADDQRDLVAQSLDQLHSVNRG